MLREAHTLVCATPSPHALYTRMSKKMVAKATMEMRCDKAGIADASSLPNTDSVYETAHNAVLKAMFFGHILMTSEEEGLLEAGYAEAWTMKDFSTAAAEKVSIISTARRDYAESRSEDDQREYASKLQDQGFLCAWDGISKIILSHTIRLRRSASWNESSRRSTWGSCLETRPNSRT